MQSFWCYSSDSFLFNSFTDLTIWIIKIVTKFDIQPDGKKKKAIDKFVYHLELCTFCNLCIEACPTNAIKMAQTFEHSTFDRTELTKILNNPGSKIRAGAFIAITIQPTIAASNNMLTTSKGNA